MIYTKIEKITKNILETIEMKKVFAITPVEDAVTKGVGSLIIFFTCRTPIGIAVEKSNNMVIKVSAKIIKVLDFFKIYPLLI